MRCNAPVTHKLIRASTVVAFSRCYSTLFMHGNGRAARATAEAEKSASSNKYMGMKRKKNNKKYINSVDWSSWYETKANA